MNEIRITKAENGYLIEVGVYGSRLFKRYVAKTASDLGELVEDLALKALIEDAQKQAPERKDQ